MEANADSSAVQRLMQISLCHRTPTLGCEKIADFFATIIDLYATGLQQDYAWRQEWAERAGLGFP